MRKIFLLILFMVVLCSFSSVAADDSDNDGMTFREFLIHHCGLSPGQPYDFHLYFEYEEWCELYGWTPVNDGWSDSGW